MRAGEVIAKLAEDTYFMRVDNSVTQVPPSGTASKTMKPPVGDRPRGPLKQWGNPYLNSCIKIS
jgi:hypothetical protein